MPAGCRRRLFPRGELIVVAVPMADPRSAGIFAALRAAARQGEERHLVGLAPERERQRVAAALSRRGAGRARSRPPARRWSAWRPSRSSWRCWIWTRAAAATRCPRARSCGPFTDLVFLMAADPDPLRRGLRRPTSRPWCRGRCPRTTPCCARTCAGWPPAGGRARAGCCCATRSPATARSWRRSSRRWPRRWRGDRRRRRPRAHGDGDGRRRSGAGRRRASRRDRARRAWWWRWRRRQPRHRLREARAARRGAARGAWSTPLPPPSACRPPSTAAPAPIWCATSCRTSAGWWRRMALRRRAEVAGRRLVETLARFGALDDAADRAAAAHGPARRRRPADRRRHLASRRLRPLRARGAGGRRRGGGADGAARGPAPGRLPRHHGGLGRGGHRSDAAAPLRSGADRQEPARRLRPGGAAGGAQPGSAARGGADHRLLVLRLGGRGAGHRRPRLHREADPRSREPALPHPARAVPARRAAVARRANAPSWPRGPGAAGRGRGRAPPADGRVPGPHLPGHGGGRRRPRRCGGCRTNASTWCWPIATCPGCPGCG